MYSVVTSLHIENCKLTNSYIDCLFQVSEINVEKQELRVVYLASPYPKKKSIWKWSDDISTYAALQDDVTRVLKEPKLITHRTGDIYLQFDELADV